VWKSKIEAGVAGKGGFTNNLGLNWTFCGCIIYESCSIDIKQNSGSSSRNYCC